MNEPTLEQESHFLMTEDGTSAANGNAIQHNFWRSFHLFPFRFDDFLFKYWYCFAIGIYLLVLIVDAIVDVHYGFPFEVSFTKVDVTKWGYILWQVGTVGVVLLFQRMRSRIPTTFQFLLDKGYVDGDEQKRFLEQYQRMLLSKKRYLLIILLLSVSVIGLVISEGTSIRSVFSLYNNYTTYSAEYSLDPRFYWVWWLIRDIPSNIFPTLLWTYSAGIAGWAAIVTGRYVRLLTVKYQLTIQPSHPDNCGGLKPLGIFSLSMALPILLAGFLLVAFDIDDILQVGTYFRPAANVFLVGFILPLAYLAFFRPIWNMHLKMLAAKAAYADEFANHIEQLKKRVQTSLDKGEVEEARVAKEEMEIQQTLHPDNIKYPTWPFDRRILLRFYIPQLVALMSAIVGLVDPVAKIVESVSKYFSNGPPISP